MSDMFYDIMKKRKQKVTYFSVTLRITKKSCFNCCVSILHLIRSHNPTGVQYKEIHIGYITLEVK